MDALTNILNHQELPRVHRVTHNLYVAGFSLMKLVLARYLVQEALRSGELTPGARVVETTSGTMGLGLAVACRETSNPVTLFSDPAIDGIRPRLEALGAEVHVVREPGPGGGYQAPRLALLHEQLVADPDAYWTRQYDNPRALDAYRTSACAIYQNVPDVDTLVVAVGSGASATGIGRHLDAACHRSVRLIGVDTQNSVLFGQRDGKRALRGLGNSILPGNLDHTRFDDVHWVAAPVAARGMIDLLQKGLDYGLTSGAAFTVAHHQARIDPDRKVVAVLPDSGERYRNWIGSACMELPRPDQVSQPSDGQTGPWSWMHWNRRTLANVTGHPTVEATR